MGIFSGKNKWLENPNAAGGPGTGGYLGLEDFGRNTGLGHAGKAAWKRIMRPMLRGDYSGIAGGLLSPIHDRYATNLRESIDAAHSGANAMYQGSQPALMAGLEDEMRRKTAEGEGLAYGQAIPSLFEGAANMYQGALDSKRNTQLNAYQSALQGRLGSGQYIKEPSLFDKINTVVSTGRNIAGLVMGMPGGAPAPSGGPPASMVNSGGTPYMPPAMSPNFIPPAPAGRPSWMPW